MAEPDKTDMAATERWLDEVAARDVPPPDADFLARLTAQAVAAMPVAVPVARARRGWRGWLAALGGWPALGGVAMAGLVGLWIGVAPPAAIDTLVAELLGDTVTVDLWSVDDPFGLEG